MADPTFKAPNGQTPEKHFQAIMLDAQPTESDALLAGHYLRTRIRQRTFADQDVSGSGFIPYSPKYAKWKGQTNVDLYSKGPAKHMLDGLSVKSGASELSPGSNPMESTSQPANSVEIGIYGDSQMASRAKLHNEGGQGRTRQGTGRHIAPRLSRKFGVSIRRQKKGGRATYTMPQREFLGANQEDLDNMRKLIVEAIEARLNRL